MTWQVAPGTRLLYVVNESYFFASHRLPVALAAQRAGFDVHLAAPADHVWAPPDFDVRELVARGFAFHPIPLSRRGRHPVTEASTLAALVRLYRGLRPALVHHMTVKPVLYGSLAARLTGVPALVNLVTGLGQLFSARDSLTRGLRRMAIAGYRLASGHPNAWTQFQNSDDLAQLASAGAVDPARASLLRGSGVDLAVFRPRPEPAGTPLVVLPARLLWDKGVAEFVAAARQLRAAGVPARFALVGATQPSNPRSVPESQLREWAASGAVEWWGLRQDMPDVLAQASIVCLPSTYGEGVPKVLLEAAASGRPAVATTIGGCREAIRDGETGLLIPPGDEVALAGALGALLQDAARRHRMGATARTLAEASFSDQEVVQQTLAVYRRLLHQ